MYTTNAAAPRSRSIIYKPDIAKQVWRYPCFVVRFSRVAGYIYLTISSSPIFHDGCMYRGPIEKLAHPIVFRSTPKTRIHIVRNPGARCYRHSWYPQGCGFAPIVVGLCTRVSCMLRVHMLNAEAAMAADLFLYPRAKPL